MPLQFPVLFGGGGNTIRSSGKRKMSGPLINMNPTPTNSRYRLSHEEGNGYRTTLQDHPVMEVDAIGSTMTTKIIITDPTDANTLHNKRVATVRRPPPRTTPRYDPYEDYPRTLSPTTASTTTWFCSLFQTVNLREVGGFLLWCGLIVTTVFLAVADWVLFFRWVVEPLEAKERVRNGAIWSIGTVVFLYLRYKWRSLSSPSIRALADHAETFVSVSLVMVFSTNIAFFLHQPRPNPLRDLGFMLIPPQDDHSKWRPLSDLMTALLPIFFFLQSQFMTRENRCRVITSFFRIATMAYALRTFTVSLTSLPGPAPHCRPGHVQYHPPQTWIDVITRVGPMYGSFFSCGDLIFSGHMAYTNTAMLLYLRTMDRYYLRFSRLRWWIGEGYLLVLAILCISGRKHYSVDVVLGWMVSTLVYFHWEHAWIPLWWSHPQIYSRFWMEERRKGSSSVSRRKSDMDIYDLEEETGRGRGMGSHKVVVEDVETIELLYPQEEEEEGEDHGQERTHRVDFIC